MQKKKSSDPDAVRARKAVSAEYAALKAKWAGKAKPKAKPAASTAKKTVAKKSVAKPAAKASSSPLRKTSSKPKPKPTTKSKVRRAGGLPQLTGKASMAPKRTARVSIPLKEYLAGKRK